MISAWGLNRILLEGVFWQVALHVNVVFRVLHAWRR